MKMAKKRDDSDGIVYSTHPGFFGGGNSDEEEAVTLAPAKQDLRLHLDRYKGNKKAVRITGFQGTDADKEALSRQLKQACACGGGVKDDYILLQGDLMDKVKQTLTKLGYRFKQSGG